MIANARMYSVTPAVKAAWKAVLRWVTQRAGVPLELLDYDAPAPLAALWARDDLGMTMMCGLPYSRRSPRARLIAAPVPSEPRYQGSPIYFTDFAVRAGSAHQTLQDTFGGVAGHTLEDSMSGYVAFRRHLLQYRRGKPLYARTMGGFVNGRQVIEALVAGKIDVGPLDSYYYDLLRKNDAAFAAQVRVVESTVAAPIPPLVATGSVEVAPLRAALLEAGTAPALAGERQALLLAGFAAPPESDYRVFDAISAQAREHAGTW